MSAADRLPTVWHIGTDDVRMRIPLLLALRERGFKVGAVGSEHGAVFAHHAIPYWRYRLGRGINPLPDLIAAIQLYRLLRQRQPDIIHAFDTKPIIMAPLVANQAGIAHRVRTVTGMGYIFSSTALWASGLRPLYRCLQRCTAAAANMTIFQNPDDRDYFLSHHMVRQDRSALVLSSGIDSEQLRSSCPPQTELLQLRQQLQLEDHLVVTLVSRLVRHKGILEYLRAAKTVSQILPNVRFLLVGPLGSEGRQAVATQDIAEYSDVVNYLGPRSDIAALLALSDVFVLPSYYREGIPRVLLEAAAMGVPLITTNMPGCKEAVRDGWNGILVPPRDVTSLVEALMALLTDPGKRTLFGQRGQALVEKFSLTSVTDRYTDIYRNLLDSHTQNKVCESVLIKS